ncbi:MAG: response regulator [Candidatus Brocadiia bacterium]|nr:MAG: response regulator [Candidatus Brocadiia bacterium]
MKILIVEDDFTSRKFLQIHLSAYGDCCIAVNGLEATEAVKDSILANEPYDLICLDIMMPEMDGHQALKTIRWLEEQAGIKAGNGAKVIMTTSMSDSKDVIGAFREGCEAYIAKPVRKEKLVAEMEKLGLIRIGVSL